MTTISVVIPTTGRRELQRAIDSARQQTGDIEVEVVVVDDSTGTSPPDATGVDQLLRTGGRRRGGFARNLGVRYASGAWVAFLDDDDEWLPNKLATQLQIAEASLQPLNTVVGSRHLHVASSGDRVSKPGPKRLIREGQSIVDYLFYRRAPSVGRASMYTSTLLCPVGLARAVPWSEELRRHQDWDWLIRLERGFNVSFVQAEEALAKIQTGSVGSISGSSDWEQSLAWARSVLRGERAYVDFLFAQTLRYALQARSWRGVRQVCAEARRARHLPGIGPAILALAGGVPRHRLDALMTRAGSASRTGYKP